MIKVILEPLYIPAPTLKICFLSTSWAIIKFSSPNFLLSPYFPFSHSLKSIYHLTLVYLYMVSAKIASLETGFPAYHPCFWVLQVHAGTQPLGWGIRYVKLICLFQKNEANKRKLSQGILLLAFCIHMLTEMVKLMSAVCNGHKSYS